MRPAANPEVQPRPSDETLTPASAPGSPGPAREAPAGSDPEVAWNEREDTQTESQPRPRSQALMRRFDEAPVASGPKTLPLTCSPETKSRGEANPHTLDPAHTSRECYPPGDFVERLCKGTYLEVALAWFRPGTPWKRAYLRTETKAWTTAPGAAETDKLRPGEEVLLLRSDADPNGGFQVSAGASYYALRWNGTCVKLTEEEVSYDFPPVRRIAPVEWNWIEDEQQAALREDHVLAKTEELRRKACKGVRRGSHDKRCEAADEALRSQLERVVRSEHQLPTPKHLP